MKPKEKKLTKSQIDDIKRTLIDNFDSVVMVKVLMDMPKPALAISLARIFAGLADIMDPTKAQDEFIALKKALEKAVNSKNPEFLKTADIEPIIAQITEHYITLLKLLSEVGHDLFENECKNCEKECSDKECSGHEDTVDTDFVIKKKSHKNETDSYIR